MANALDAFRAQKEAADQVHERLTEAANLVKRLAVDVDGIVTKELRELLREEQRWLAQAQELVKQVQWAREQEVARYWPSIWRRWAVAIAFAIASIAAAGASFSWAAKPYSAEIADLRQRAEFGDRFLRRIAAMNSVQRRQLESLLIEPTRNP